MLRQDTDGTARRQLRTQRLPPFPVKRALLFAAGSAIAWVVASTFLDDRGTVGGALLGAFCGLCAAIAEWAKNTEIQLGLPPQPLFQKDSMHILALVGLIVGAVGGGFSAWTWGILFYPVLGLILGGCIGVTIDAPKGACLGLIGGLFVGAAIGVLVLWMTVAADCPRAEIWSDAVGAGWFFAITGAILGALAEKGNSEMCERRIDVHRHAP